MAIKTFKGTNKFWVVVKVFWGSPCCSRPVVLKAYPPCHQLHKYHLAGLGAGGSMLSSAPSPGSLNQTLQVDPTIWFYLLTYLAVPGLSWYMEGGIFYLCWGMPTLSCSIWDLVPWVGIKPWTPALGPGSLSHLTFREVLTICILTSPLADFITHYNLKNTLVYLSTHSFIHQVVIETK